MLTKKQVIRSVAFLATHSGLLSVFSSVGTRFRQNGVVIVAYHKIGEREDGFEQGIMGPPTRQDFEEQVAYLCQEYEIISLPELVERIQGNKALPQKGAAITFDDGYKLTYTYAYPVLRRYNIPATVFLTTGHIGNDNPFWWDKLAHIIANARQARLHLEELGEHVLTTPAGRLKAVRGITRRLKRLPEERKNQLLQMLERIAGADLPPSPNEAATLSWSEVEEMSQHDITFGSHTVTHPILTKVSAEQANREIAQSKKDIEQHLGKPVNLFCYPNGESGDFNEETKRLLKENGLSSAFSLIRGTNTLSTDLYELRRFSVTGGGLDTFKLLLSGIVPELAFKLLAR